MLRTFNNIPLVFVFPRALYLSNLKRGPSFSVIHFYTSDRPCAASKEIADDKLELELLELLKEEPSEALAEP